MGSLGLASRAYMYVIRNSRATSENGMMEAEQTCSVQAGSLDRYEDVAAPAMCYLRTKRQVQMHQLKIIGSICLQNIEE